MVTVCEGAAVTGTKKGVLAQGRGENTLRIIREGYEEYCVRSMFLEKGESAQRKTIL